MSSNAEPISQQAKPNVAFSCNTDPRWLLIGTSNAGVCSNLCSAFQSGYLSATKLWLEGSMEGKKTLHFYAIL